LLDTSNNNSLMSVRRPNAANLGRTIPRNSRAAVEEAAARLQ
jgi:hypothetical protein